DLAFFSIVRDSEAENQAEHVETLRHFDLRRPAGDALRQVFLQLAEQAQANLHRRHVPAVTRRFLPAVTALGSQILERANLGNTHGSPILITNGAAARARIVAEGAERVACCRSPGASRVPIDGDDRDSAPRRTACGPPSP